MMNAPADKVALPRHPPMLLYSGGPFLPQPDDAVEAGTVPAGETDTSFVNCGVWVCSAPGRLHDRGLRVVEQVRWEVHYD